MKGTKEKEKKIVSSAEIENFSEKFKKEFSLVSIVSSGDSNNFEYNRTWIVDSGATSHMTGMLDTFMCISEIGPGQFVNGTQEVRGIGKVKFQLVLGETLEVDRVLFVPGLRVSLLSVAALEDDGYTVVI